MDVTIDRGSFGPILRRLRQEARISQEELAERAHLSVESISALERGRRRAPYRETIRMLSDGLRLSDTQRSELEAAARRPSPAAVNVTRYDSTASPLSRTYVLSECDEPRQNLPLQRKSPVGRKIDIETIVRMMADNRLVTLTGTGGIGKTLIALAVGDALLETTEDRVWLVELAPVPHGSLVASSVAHALNVREHAKHALHESLIAHLREKPFVLILDNCEHVIAEASVLVNVLLNGCSRLRILTTSREPLRIGSERTYRVPSLRVPRKGHRRLTASGAGDYPAVVLFTQRAQRSDHHFVLDDENAPIIAEICRRLDGIPLAIELAAARVNVLSLQALLSRLDQRFRVLTGGDRTALPRQQTMHATIDWSYDLLSAPEQRLFERLSVFAGGCTLASLAAVYSDDVVDEAQVFELLSSLVNKSLVTADLDVPEPRYRLPESTRQYADEKLALRGELALIEYRHALQYVNLAEQLEREHDTTSNSVWFARAELEVENWRTALRWTLVERGDTVLGQRLTGAMRTVWPAYSIAERRRWLHTALDSIDERTPRVVAANLEHAVATVAYLCGEYQNALTISRGLTVVYSDLGDSLRVAYAQFLAGRSLAALGQVEESDRLLQTSLDSARALENNPLAALALSGLARSSSAAGNVAAARAQLAEAFALCDVTGAGAYWVLVESAAASVEFQAGNFERALQLSSEALSTMRTIGLTLFVTIESNLLAAYLIAADRWHEAREQARDALDLAQETQQLVEVAWALQHLAAAAVLSADYIARAPSSMETAGRLLGYVDVRITALGVLRQETQQQEYDRVLCLLRATISLSELETFLALGSATTEEQAIESARSLLI